MSEVQTADTGSFDELIHSPRRLRICGLLRRAELEFSVIRDAIGVSDAQLSKNLRTLAEAGYVKLSKASSSDRSDARRLTWVTMTPAGSAAFDGHLAALRAIAG